MFRFFGPFNDFYTVSDLRSVRPNKVHLKRCVPAGLEHQIELLACASGSIFTLLNPLICPVHQSNSELSAAALSEQQSGDDTGYREDELSLG